MAETIHDNDGNLSLRVSEAKKKDIGRGIARIDPDLTGAYNLNSGDAIMISNPKNKKKTAALLWPGYREDAGAGTIRIDGPTRQISALHWMNELKLEK